MITTSRLKLIRIESEPTYDEINLHQSWLNNPEISKWRNSKYKLYTKREIENWYKKTAKSTDSIHLKIFKQKSAEDTREELSGFRRIFENSIDNTENWIGMISLQNINHIDSNAEIAFFIGETIEHGKGYITEAVEALVNYGFNNLNLHRIYGATPNPAAKKVFTKLGFKKEGEQVEAFKINNKYVNHYNYYIININK